VPISNPPNTKYPQRGDKTNKPKGDPANTQHLTRIILSLTTGS
jgi:hypothetical protein